MAFIVIIIQDNRTPSQANRFHSKLCKFIPNPCNIAITLEDHSNIYDHLIIDQSNHAFFANMNCRMIQANEHLSMILRVAFGTVVVLPSPTTRQQFGTMFAEFIRKQGTASHSSSHTSGLVNTSSSYKCTIKHPFIPIHCNIKTTTTQEAKAYLSNIDTASSILCNIQVMNWLRSKVPVTAFNSMLIQAWALLATHESQPLIHVFKVNDLKHLHLWSETMDDDWLLARFKGLIGDGAAIRLLNLANSSKNVVISGDVMTQLLTPTIPSSPSCATIDVLCVGDNYDAFVKLARSYVDRTLDIDRVTNQITMTCVLPYHMPYTQVHYQHGLRLCSLGTNEFNRKSKPICTKNPRYTNTYQDHKDLLTAQRDVCLQCDPLTFDNIKTFNNCKVKTIMRKIIKLLTNYVLYIFVRIDMVQQLVIRFVTKDDDSDHGQPIVDDDTAKELTCVVHLKSNVILNSSTHDHVVRFVSVSDVANDPLKSAVNHLVVSNGSKSFYHDGQVHVTSSVVSAVLPTRSVHHPSVSHMTWVQRLGYSIVTCILFHLEQVHHIVSVCKALDFNLRTLDIARLLQRKINDRYAYLAIDVSNTPSTSHPSLNIWRDKYSCTDFIIKLVTRNMSSSIDFFPRQSLMLMLDSYHYKPNQIKISDDNNLQIVFQSTSIIVHRKINMTLYKLKLAARHGIPIIQVDKSQVLVHKLKPKYDYATNTLTLGQHPRCLYRTCLVAHVTSGNSDRGFKHLKYKLGTEASNIHYTCKIQVNSDIIVISCPKNDSGVISINCPKNDPDVFDVTVTQANTTNRYQYMLGNKSAYLVDRDYIIDQHEPRSFGLKDRVRIHNFDYVADVASLKQGYDDGILARLLMLNYWVANLIGYYEKYEMLPVFLCDTILVNKC
ncbi:Hypothetical protein MVR_LOCUS381 [uncultured virus]|nr:Hypothetical protein MVR_LOCUS381 [uncultured virus]